ncbi:MAG: VWA domain-containing protein, partial [Actinobacteria bacterium]|nr:VWA domain-containing protein [Actinomycetota bacterium]NIU71265.1 VWA domain-containing protein [Actinomycetota bacterium]NIW33220.1 VWA domain-containing protein [Actinomycetota bacterium]
LVAALLALPVVIAFLVRTRKKSVTVPSTHLWRRVAISRVRNRRFRFLTRLLALVACVLAVSLLSVAAARPLGRSSGMTVAIVVDVSSSMEGEPLDEARRVVGRYLSARGATDQYTIIAAGPEIEHLVGPTDDAARLT